MPDIKYNPQSGHETQGDKKPQITESKKGKSPGPVSLEQCKDTINRGIEVLEGIEPGSNVSQEKLVGDARILMRFVRASRLDGEVKKQAEELYGRIDDAYQKIKYLSSYFPKAPTDFCEAAKAFFKAAKTTLDAHVGQACVKWT